MNTLLLPNLKITSKNPIFTNEHLLVLGGRAPNLNWLKTVSKNRILWAVDRGVNSIKKTDLFPDFLIGDNDSADKNIWNDMILNNVNYEKYPSEKDYTDLELALTKLPVNSFAILTGAFGGRFDHIFSNIFSAAHAKNRICLADEKETLLFLKDNDEFQIIFDKIPVAISLVSITDKCINVTLKGTHWPLKNSILYQNNPYTISNILENTNTCEIKISEGILGVYILNEENFL